MLGAIVAACAVVGVILFNLAPEPGQSADGSPIAPTTTESPTTTEAPTTTEVDESAEEAQDDGPFAEFESVEPDAFVFEVVEADLGWFGLANTPVLGGNSLVRSLDGLRWTPVDTGLSDVGSIVGLAKVSDAYVVGVDTSTRDSDQFEVQFFESVDAQSWEPSSRYEAITGDGIFGILQIDESGALALVERGDVSDEASGQDALVRYFDSVLPPEQAEAVCSVGARAADDDGGSDISVLRSCAGEVIAEITPESAPSLFVDRNFPARCVEVLRDGQQFSIGVELSSLADGRASAPMPSGFSPFGIFTDGTFLALPDLSSRFDPFAGCLSDDAEQGEPNSVLLWTVDGPTTVSLPDAPIDNGNFRSPLQAAESGEVLIFGETGLMRSSPPFLEWDLLPLPEIADVDSQEWAYVQNGRFLFGQGQNRIVFVDIDGTLLREIDGISGNDFIGVLLATEEFAVVSLNSARESRLVKVPFGER